jgi:mannose-6-phosphate isomerase-like protein (cupin superfamily)
LSQSFDLPKVVKQRAQLARPYHEFLRVPAMSAGIYVLPAQGVDQQQLHNEDELYYVIRGKAKLKLADRDLRIQSGSMVFVEAGLDHRFCEIEQELEILVVFAPAESI